jgi:hypothetical protein
VKKRNDTQRLTARILAGMQLEVLGILVRDQRHHDTDAPAPGRLRSCVTVTYVCPVETLHLPPC